MIYNTTGLEVVGAPSPQAMELMTKKVTDLSARVSQAAKKAIPFLDRQPKKLARRIVPILGTPKDPSYWDGRRYQKYVEGVIRNLPQTERQKFADQVDRFGAKNGVDGAYVVNLLDGIVDPSSFVADVLELIQPMAEKSFAIEEIATIPKEERIEFVKQALRLTKNSLGSQQHEIVHAMVSIPRGDLEKCVDAAVRLITNEMNGKERSEILKKVSSIPNREAQVSEVVKFIEALKAVEVPSRDWHALFEDLQPINQWEVAKDGPKFKKAEESNIFSKGWNSFFGQPENTPKDLFDTKTGKIYLNETKALVRLKCFLLSLGTPVIQTLTIGIQVFYLLEKTFSNLFDQNLSLKEKGKKVLQNVLRMLLSPLAGVALEITALYGILSPYNGRKLYATIEREMYDPDFQIARGLRWEYLAPCFQPSPKRHLMGGDIDKAGQC